MKLMRIIRKYRKLLTNIGKIDLLHFLQCNNEEQQDILNKFWNVILRKFKSCITIFEIKQYI